MAQEIETARFISTSELPTALEEYPWTDITQTYLTPFPADERFPELADAELRLRHSVNQLGETACLATAKFGDKQSGQRTEIETELGSEGRFDKLKIEELAYGIIKKRRYDLGKKHTIDIFDSSLHGDIAIEEQEYSDWQTVQPPTEPMPSNRELAIPVANTSPQLAPSSYEDLLTAIEQRYRRQGKLLVTISGMSGSGKTTLAERVAAEIDATLIKGDDFHVGTYTMQNHHLDPNNHDHPHVYDYSGAGEAAYRIMNGKQAWIPQYDFATAERLSERRVIPGNNKGLVVVDGLYAKQAGGSSAFHVLVDRPVYACILRRLLRDSAPEFGGQSNGRDNIFEGAAGSLKYIMETAVPTYLKNQPPVQDFDAIA